MAKALDLTVTLRGGLFAGGIPQRVQAAMIDEVLRKVEERLLRPPSKRVKALGRLRNRLTADERKDARDLVLNVKSTRIWPRTRGTAWQRKNIAIVKAMAPRVANKAAQRIAAEMM